VSEDGRPRSVRTRPEQPDERQRLIEAVILLAGERGYDSLTLTEVVEHVGTHNRNFHRHFDSLEEAFAVGYEQLASELCEQLLSAGRGASEWRVGFRAAMARFLEWVDGEPGPARVILSEYRVAGPRAFEAHEAISKRLASAIDASRPEDPERRHSPMATRLLLGAIEFMVIDPARRGKSESAAQLEGALAFFAISLYFGDDVAAEELG
jgi:AcrR family transcriptional regulator